MLFVGLNLEKNRSYASPSLVSRMLLGSFSTLKLSFIKAF
jgi:hypothetical protein